MKQETRNRKQGTGNKEQVLRSSGKTFPVPCSLFPKKGQVMILTILALGGTILVGTTVAGLLVVYQIRQSADLANSAKAVFAADSGIEWGFYQFFKSSSSVLPSAPPSFANGASVAVTCYTGSGDPAACADSSIASIRAIGKSGSAHRAFEQSL